MKGKRPVYSCVYLSVCYLLISPQCVMRVGGCLEIFPHPSLAHFSPVRGLSPEAACVPSPPPPAFCQHHCFLSYSQNAASAENKSIVQHCVCLHELDQRLEKVSCLRWRVNDSDSEQISVGFRLDLRPLISPTLV